MKNTPLLIIMLAALLVVGIHAFAQTNSAPIVDQPQSTTVTNFSPGIIWSTPTQTAAFCSAYLVPMTTQAGLVTPTGAVTKTVTITFYKDGSAQFRAVYVQPSQLQPPPPNFGK